MTRVLFRVVFVVVVTATALVGCEFALRYVFRHAATSGNAHDFVGQHGPAPAIRVNNVGFRDRDVPPKSAKYRIAVVGDSFAWGQGVEERDRFSDLIEKSLGSGYEVFNFGRPGNNMPEHLDVLSQVVSKFRLPRCEWQWRTRIGRSGHFCEAAASKKRGAGEHPQQAQSPQRGIEAQGHDPLKGSIQLIQFLAH